MKILYKPFGSVPIFEVVASEGRSIINKFIDYSTQYLVVQETRTADPNDRNIYFTLLNANTGAVIPWERRSKEVAGKEEVVVQGNLSLRTTRTVDQSIGQETLHETLSDVMTGYIIATSKSIAFSEHPRASLLVTYLEWRSEEQLWAREYAQKSQEEKELFWLDSILRQMHMQSEAGLDTYAIFTPERYNEWRRLEPNIDQILEFVIAHFPDDSEVVRAKIASSLGKTKPDPS